MDNCTNCEEVLDKTTDCQEAEESKPSGKLSIGRVIFSIISMLLFNQTFGILGLVMALLAQNAKNAKDEALKLKLSNTFNIIAIVQYILTYVSLYLFFVVYFGLIFMVAIIGILGSSGTL